ncbi:hypothetical protein BpHYR1_054057 [Brachionus plicatilis]|uniref:Uncharacterized protein n=1 Tax=Brachionus plicatilis TaxID=10195 RepID=A0A3M7T906_BRAPC|nr:hypothetical protein BpHYR1_054057 [Brachionus plicatilis]
MNNVPMVQTNVERDLGIYLTSDLKWSHQASQAANKANTATKARLCLALLRSPKSLFTIVKNIMETNFDENSNI